MTRVPASGYIGWQRFVTTDKHWRLAERSAIRLQADLTTIYAANGKPKGELGHTEVRRWQRKIGWEVRAMLLVEQNL